MSHQIPAKITLSGSSEPPLLDEKFISEVRRLLKARGPPSPTSVTSSGLEFENEEEMASRANALASDFLKSVIGKTLTVMEYFSRLSVRAIDVAIALENFVKTNSEAPENKQIATEGEGTNCKVEEEEEEGNEEEWVENEDEASDMEEDSESVAGSDHGNDTYDEEGNIFNIDEKNPTAPTFDANFEPVGDISYSDSAFETKIVTPIVETNFRTANLIKGDANSLLKKALFAYIVSKLSWDMSSKS